MLKIIDRFRAWRAASAQREAELWRAEALRCALIAYSLDPMREPLRWGRLQNRVNWCRNNERAAIAKATGAVQ